MALKARRRVGPLNKLTLLISFNFDCIPQVFSRARKSTFVTKKTKALTFGALSSRCVQLVAPYLPTDTERVGAKASDPSLAIDYNRLRFLCDPERPLGLSIDRQIQFSQSGHRS